MSAVVSFHSVCRSACVLEVRYIGGEAHTLQFLPAADPRHESRNPHVLNNREIKDKGQIPLLAIEYQLGKGLDLCKAPKGSYVEVKFSREHLQQAARQMKKRNLWGTCTYTSDSDILCALVHMGYLPARALEPSFSWPETMRELCAILQICGSEPPFPASVRNGVRSRSWDQECYMCGFAIRRCWMAVLLPGASAGVRHSPCLSCYIIRAMESLGVLSKAELKA